MLFRSGLIASGRYLHILIPLPDRPGQLARVSEIVAGQNANVIEVLHTRHGVGLQINEVQLSVDIETRGPEHSEQVMQALRDEVEAEKIAATGRLTLKAAIEEVTIARMRERQEALLASVRTPDAYLTEIASHLLVAGGKRLRPMFSVVASQVAGAPATDDAVQGGISCELVHLGSLYHDDVMDESPTRRGVDTVNAKWGNLQAILAGDFLLARASEIAASLGTEVAGLLARTIGRLCEGQIEELRHTYNVARPVDSYLSSINGKTASLYGTAARIGGLVSKFDRKIVDALTASPLNSTELGRPVVEVAGERLQRIKQLFREGQGHG